MLLRGRAGSCLQLQPPLQERTARSATEQCLRQEPVDEHPGKQSRRSLFVQQLLGRLGMFHRPLGVHEHGGLDEQHGDPGVQLTIVGSHRQGLLKALDNRLDRPGIPLDIGQEQQGACAQGRRWRVVDRPLPE